MKSASSTFSAVVLASVAVLLTGCPKKPVRPAPDQTVMGQGAGNAGTNGALNPTDVNANNGLQPGSGIDVANGIRNLVDPVFFNFDQSDIRAGERSKVQKAKETLDQHPEYHLTLEGHCDWRGTAEYNLALGDRRANAVKKYLAKLGVGADKLDTVSKGSEDAAKNADKAAAAHDRRVEFVFTGGAPAGAPAPAAAGTPPPATP